jgi:transposase-like protein
MTGARRLSAAQPASTAPAEASTRRRHSWSDRQAAVAQLRRLANGGRPLPLHVQAVAAKFGVSTRAVYHWFKTIDPTAPRPEGRRTVYTPTVEHLTVLAHEQNMAAAHERLHEAGLITCSYETFARAIRERTDPTLVAAAIEGYPGLVNNRPYLSWRPPHRNHTWYLDHTILDLWVWPSHKHRAPIRPQVTVVVDGYSSLLHAIPWKTNVNGDMVAAGLVEFGTERDYFGVRVGGMPEQVVCDNAAQHFGPSMREGVRNLGWIMTPTAAYFSWQNGPAERHLGLLNQRLANRAPGATKAGRVYTGASRHAAKLPKDIKPHEVLPWGPFTDLLQDTVNEINTTIRMRKHGRTRLKAYATDPTEQRFLDPVEYRTALMTSGDMTYMWTKNGLNFDGAFYFGTGMEYGRRYLIRYLPTNRDFIEVFDLHGEWVCQALRADRMTREQVAPFMAERAEKEREFKAIEAGAIAHRQQMAAAAAAGALYGDEETDYDGSADRAAALAADPDTTVTAADSVAAEDASDAHGEAVPPARTAPRNGRKSGRPAAPRVPVTAEPDPAAEAARTRANDRLSAKYGAALPGVSTSPPAPSSPARTTSGDPASAPNNQETT